jgi:hypothetical protein
MTVSGINMAYSNNGGIGPQDGDILVTLKEGTAHGRLCEGPARRPAAPVSRHQLRLPARRHREPDPQLRRARPIDVVVTGNTEANEAYANAVAAG